MLKWLVGAFLALVGLAALIGVGGYFALKRNDIAYETLAARYENAASRYVDLPGGVRMHYRDQGDPNGPLLLMVHGYSDSLLTWERWAALLGEEYRIVTLDLPGHGLTRAPADFRPSIETLRDAVADFTRAQGLSNFTLIGNSMGGNIAWEYALAHPEQLNALVLADASGWEETRAQFATEPPIFRWLRNPIAGPLLRDLDNTALTRQGLIAAFVDPALVDDALMARYTELPRAPGHRAILLKLMLDFRSRNYATPERLAPLAAMPVLIMSGGADVLVPPEHAQQFHAAIAGSELVMFDGVGHVPQEIIPEQSAAALSDFLARRRGEAETAAIAAQ